MSYCLLSGARNVLLVMASLLLGVAAYADTFVWKGASGGSWNMASNWEPETVPNGSGVEVDLSAASGTYAIAVSSAVTVGKITVNGATATTLTLSGQKITFAASSKPEIAVGTGHTLLTTTTYGGTQGVKKTGGGTWKPTAQAASNSFSGGITVEDGSLQIVKNGSNPHFCGSVEVLKGATFTLLAGDTLSSSFSLLANGGTIDFHDYIDYAGALTFSNGGLMNCGNNLYLIDNNAATASITANGTGVAGTFSGPLVGESRYGQYKNNRTIQVNVANSGAEFKMTGYLLENRLQGPNYGNDIYHGETAAPYFPVISLKKIGEGDLVLYDETISLTGPTTVDAGRLILSNTVKMAASAITLKTGVSQLVLREGATLQIGGINCDTAETLDLGGNTVSVGGTATDSSFAGTFTNGKIRKVGYNTQQIGAGLSQSDLDVLGGTLAIGLPAPKVRYTFDDAANLGADAGTLGKTLAAEKEGAATYAEGGISGGCASFNGTGCLLAAAATGLPSGNAAFTISLWMKTTSTKANLSFSSWGNNTGNQYNGFLMQSSTQLKHTFWEGGVDFVSKSRASSLADGAWHHIALTYDPSAHSRTYYIDGVQFDSQMNAQYTRAVPEGNPFKVGFSQNSANFIGQMDEVMVFDRALTAAEVAAVKSWGDGAIATEAFASGGTVRLERDATLALSTVSQSFASISGKGTLALNNGAKATVSSGSIGRLAGDGTLTKTGDGALSLTAAANMGATLDVQGGAVSATGPCTDADLKSHLIAHWDFNDRNDPGKDVSGNGVNIAPYTVSGTGNNSGIAYNWRNAFETVGGAAYLDGKNTYYFVMADSANEAKLPGGANPTFTVAMWINPDSDVGNNAGLFYWGAATAGPKVCVAMRFNSGTQLNPFFWGGGDYKYTLPADFKMDVVPDGWHHVVFAAGGDSHVRALYVDGEYVAGGSNSTALNVPSANFCLGKDISQNVGFKGYLDDVMIFDKALTADEVKAVMNGLGDAPTGGSKVKLADNASFAVASGTVGLSGVTGEGDVSVADGSALVLAGGATELEGALIGSGAVTVTNGASLHLAGGQNFPGTLTVAAGGTLDCRNGAAATVKTLKLAEGAAFHVVASDFTTAPCVAVTDAVDLPAAVSISVNVPAGTGARIEVLHSAGGINGDVSSWSVDWQLPGRSWSAKIYVEDSSVWVESRAPGMIMFVF